MDGSGTADQVGRAAQSPDDFTAHTREVDPLTVTQRLQREGRWYGQIELERDEMMKLAKGQFPDKRERQQWVYGELDRMYPPLKKQTSMSTDEKTSHFTAVVAGEKSSHSSKPDDGPIQGLAAIPEAWPDLRANASLSAEIGWVQANRLPIVEERTGTATRVDLAAALHPAPSWSALGWLETSIRSYAKFVDVAAKATGAADDEASVLRRERMAIDEMRAVMDEMRGDETVCPRCNRPW